ASTLRAELWVQRIRMFVVIGSCLPGSPSAACGTGTGDDGRRLAARSRGRAAGRLARVGAWRRHGLAFVEYGDAAQRVEGLPGDALRIGHPVLLAAGVATGRLAFVEQGHVGGLRASLHLCEVFGIVSLDAEMVDAGPAAPRGDGEVARS